MPKRSNKFQKLVTAIHACIANDVHVEESAFLVDKETGKKREVDILLQSRFGDYPIFMSVEVIDRSRRAGSGWVEEMAGKHQALATHKLVLVSRSGFTKPALAKAKARKIEALTIKEAWATDWHLALRLEGQGVFKLFNVHFSCSAHLDGKNDWFPAPLSAKIFLPGDKRPTEVRNIVKFVVSDPRTRQAVLDHFDLAEEQDYHAVYTPPEGTLFENSSDVPARLIKLSIGLHLEFEATPVEYSSGRFRGRDIAYGQASESDNSLCFVMTKKENGEIEGLLYDSDRFRRLLVDTKTSSGG
jgi:hypothetical protein